MKIEVVNNQKEISISSKEIEKAAVKFLRHLKQNSKCSLNIVFTSEEEIKKVNKIYFNKNTITDVIAIDCGKFSKDIYKYYLGDIVICPHRAKTNAKKFKTTIKREIFLYVAHGILHLLKYDDLKKSDRLKMEREQNKLMDLI